MHITEHALARRRSDHVIAGKHFGKKLYVIATPEPRKHGSDPGTNILLALRISGL